MRYLSKSSELVERGRQSFEWAKLHMPALELATKYVRRKITKNRNQFAGLRLAACLHVSKETAVLVHALHLLGLEIKLVAANPLSSQPDIAAFLSSEGITVNALRGETLQNYENDIRNAAKSRPDLIVDDGGELHVAYALHGADSCFGGTDETTSGTMRLRSLDNRKKLRYPVIPVNEARTKHLFDNRYGTGQSALDGLVRATGLLIAGKRTVIAGYGWVGKGVANRLSGLGAKVIVTEVEPTRALEALLDGYEVSSINDAAKTADVILTCTGQIDVIGTKQFPLLKDGAIIGNVGHFDQEIDVRGLFKIGERVEEVRDNVARVRLGKSKKSIYLLSQGRVVNLAAAEGHPPEVMQLSFANQLLALDYLIRHRSEDRKMPRKLLSFPKEIDDLVAGFALQAFNLRIDKLSRRQKKYADSFNRLVSER